jgi:hypothetical protein
VAFLQNAPVVRHTRGFTPGWYAVPRWGTPNGSTPPSTRPPRPSATQPHPYTKPQQRNQPENPLNPALTPRAPPAAAGLGRSKHRKRSNIPLARSAKAPSSPELPCERRTDPAEPLRGTHPQRQPWHFATAKQVRAPGSMWRSFRTHRLCGIPGVSPRAGMRCPVGALRTPHLPRAFPRSPHKYAQRSGIEPERALEANSKNPSRTARKPLLPRASSASAGSIPRSPHRAPGPSASPSTRPPQNR